MPFTFEPLYSDPNDPNNEKSKDSYVVFEFPSGIRTYASSESCPYMKITAFEYKRGIRTDTTKDRVFSIILPLPANLQQSHSASYSQFKMDAVLDSFFNGVQPEGTMAKLATIAGAEATSEVGSIAGKYAASKLGIGKEFFDRFNNNANAYSSIFGIVFNPRIETAFNAMNLRQHTYEYTIVPKNKKESLDVKNMIRLLEDAMYPTFADPFKVFLEYPMEFTIDYFTADGLKIEGVLPVPDSFLDTFSVGINPIGGLSRLHSDGSPIAYRLQMNFREANQLTRESLRELRDRNAS